MRFTRSLIFLIIILLVPISYARAQNEIVVANGVSVSPSIIDETAIVKDLFDYKIKIKNNGNHMVQLYPIVSDLSAEGGLIKYNGPGSADKHSSLASWLSFARGQIELLPGAETEIALNIRVDSYAPAGKYHAKIAFPEGNNRKLAEEAMADRSYPDLMININVEDEIIEKTQINEFKSQKNIYFILPAEFKLELTNFGNRDSAPHGRILIYNRRGKEIDEVKVNEENEAIAPNETKTWNLRWGETGFGKYKAKLEIEYGEVARRDLQDTVYFWVLPFRFLMLFVGFALIITIVATFFIFRRTYVSGHRPVGPPAGAAKEHVIDLKNKK